MIVQTIARYLKVKVFLHLIAIGAGINFCLIWQFANQEFAGIGLGPNGTGACFLAGVVWWFWFWSTMRPHGEIADDATILPLVLRLTFYSFAISPVCIVIGRLVFSILPPWSNSFGAVVGFIVSGGIRDFVWRQQRPPTSSVDRGTKTITPEEAERQIRRLPKGREHRIRWAGYDLPGEVSQGNFLVPGTVGTGKSLMIHDCMRSVLPNITPRSDLRALLYDVKADVMSVLLEMKLQCDIVNMNPFDQRGWAWDISADVTTPEQAIHFAEALIPPPPKNAETNHWVESSRSIVAGVINAFNRNCPQNWTLRDVIRATASRKRLEALLEGTDLIDRFFKPPNTFSNTLNTIGTVTTKLEPVAALWERTPRKRRKSLTDWARHEESILVFGGVKRLQPSLGPLNRVMFKHITETFLAGEESPDRTRLWFFCDELRDAGRLDALQDLVNARSKGGRCVLGFQDLEGLYSFYGEDQAKEIISRFSNVSILQLSSTDTANWASQRTGECERWETSTGISDGKVSTNKSLVKREAVLPSQFMNLPRSTTGSVEGFHRIVGLDGIVRRAVQYPFTKQDPAVNFAEREDKSEQELAPWTVRDALRLNRVGHVPDDEDEEEGEGEGGDEGGDASAIDDQPKGPDLDEIGRITF